jgi:hypothetical protein
MEISERLAAPRRREIALIFVVALAVRLLYCWAVLTLPLGVGAGQKAFYDGYDGYMRLGINLVDHHQFTFDPAARPTTFRLPAYPAAIALGYLLTGTPVLATVLVNCLASALTCAAAYLILLRVHPGGGGLVVGIVPAFFPFSVHYCATAWAATFITLAVTLYVLTLIRLVQQPTLVNAIWSGGAFALAALSVNVVFPLAAVFVVLALALRRSLLKPAMISAAVGYVLVSGWMLRTYAICGRMVPSTGSLGYSLLVGNHMIGGPHLNSDWNGADQRAAQYLRERYGRDMCPERYHTANFFDFRPGSDDVHLQAAMGMFRERPTLLPRKIAENLLHVWYRDASPRNSLVHAALNFSVLALAGVFLFRTARRRPSEVGVILVTVLWFALTYAAIIAAYVKYCLSALMLLVPFAAEEAWSWLAGTRRVQPANTGLVD